MDGPAQTPFPLAGRGACVRRTAAAFALGAFLLLAVPAPAQAQATGEGITVAVLDSGIDGNHPELQGRVERMSFQAVVPGVPLDPSQAFPDPDGQGTAVASLVAGATLGVAPQARLLDMQVSARYGGQSVGAATEQNAIQAMDYLLQHPERAQVVLLSFASRGVSAGGASTLAKQAEGLRDAGVLVVAPLASSFSAIQSDPEVVTVGGTDCGVHQGDATHARKPDLVAPSSGLRAAQASSVSSPAGGGTATVSGTAYAAAQVAGAGALLFDARDRLPADAAASFLRDTAADLGPEGPDDCNGFGLLSPDAAVAAAQAWSDPLVQFPTKPTPGLAAATLLAGLAASAAVLRRRA
jgi:subtilisin family serine protease